MPLKVCDIKVQYGKANAIKGVSLNIEEGEIVTVIGSNGAGKTTILRTISGLKKLVSGEIWFENARIDGLPAHEIVKLGVAHIPAGRMIFAPMTVLENLKIGACLRKDKDKVKQDIEAIYKYFPILKEKKSQLGGQLSGGQQQMLAIGRALMSAPKLLILDEPSTGLSPILVTEICNIIRDINKEGISILLVEQNCRMALKLAKRAYVLELGSITLEGEASKLANDERVKECYFGGI